MLVSETGFFTSHRMSELEHTFAPEQEMHLQEKCGIVALYHPTDSMAQQVSLALTAADGVQHRGQQGGGIALHTETGIRTHFGPGLLKDVFPAPVRAALGEPSYGNWALVHARYGTYGGYDSRNLQPTLAQASDGSTIAVIHNGQFVAVDSMRAEVDGSIPHDISDTYLFTQILASAEGANWDARVVSTLNRRDINGAYSLAIGINDDLYLARDRFGIRPLVLGRIGNGWIAASETYALDRVGATTEREVKRGEILKVSGEGLRTLQEGMSGPGNFCDFEWDYFSRPNALAPTHDSEDDSEHPERWMSMLVARERCGEILAQEKPIPHIDFVVGVPDSGVAFATGYARGMNKPYRQVILRDHYNENGNLRLFQTDNDMNGIRGRVRGNTGKLSLARGVGIWQDAVVFVGDDSMVRSNVGKEVTEMIFEAGAREVHLGLGFPPVEHPCYLGVSMRTAEELIAVRHHGNEAAIAREVGATSVTYISHEGFIRSRKQSGVVMPEDPRDIFLANGGCGGCITGRYPISSEGKLSDLASKK